MLPLGGAIASSSLSTSSSSSSSDSNNTSLLYSRRIWRSTTLASFLVNPLVTAAETGLADGRCCSVPASGPLVADPSPRPYRRYIFATMSSSSDSSPLSSSESLSSSTPSSSLTSFITVVITAFFINPIPPPPPLPPLLTTPAPAPAPPVDVRCNNSIALFENLSSDNISHALVFKRLGEFNIIFFFRVVVSSGLSYPLSSTAGVELIAVFVRPRPPPDWTPLTGLVCVLRRSCCGVLKNSLAAVKSSTGGLGALPKFSVTSNSADLSPSLSLLSTRWLVVLTSSCLGSRRVA
mmetsp:Transcript_5116/g.8379  ORF Transcript_5116/g.8379 Transcript_5116/m.8379 type:complete len:293 (-) Transcript_5116:738-1616(-)